MPSPHSDEYDSDDEADATHKRVEKSRAERGEDQASTEPPRNLSDDLRRAKTVTPTKLVVWNKPLISDSQRATRRRSPNELEEIIERGTEITMELYEEAPEREELANFSLPQMSAYNPMERLHKTRDSCPLFGCGRSHVDYKHLRPHLVAHREALLKNNAFIKEGYPPGMLEPKSGKKVTTENIDVVKIFSPPLVKRRGNSSYGAKETIEELAERLKKQHASGAEEDGETFEEFADRVFTTCNIEASAAKRLWYKRHEVMARLNKWIFDLELEDFQEYEVKVDTRPDTLFYKNGSKRTITEVENEIRDLKTKRQQRTARLSDYPRDHPDHQQRLNFTHRRG
jgi:hypothetical protein